MTHREKAMSNFRAGYNCAQAVLLAFSDETGLDSETALKLSSSFGGGMGRLREVCGAVSGIFMAAGIIYGYSSPSDKEAKAEHYKRIQQFAAEFKEKNGSIICRELLSLKTQSESPTPSDRTEQYYGVRPCERMVGDAAEILEKYISETDK